MRPTTRNITLGLFAVAITPAMAFTASRWEIVRTPNPSDVINVITDSDTGGSGLHALLIEDNALIVGNPAIPHVIRRDASDWTDIAGPPNGNLDGTQDYFTVHVGADGTVWLGGVSEDNPSLQAKPAVASFQDGAWSEPVVIDMFNQVLYPFHERGGEIYAMDTAPDGTIFAVGWGKNWGLTDDSSIPLFLINDGAGWKEMTNPATDWPGSNSANTQLSDVIAFSSDNVWAVGSHASAYDGAYAQGGLIVHWDGQSLTTFEDPRSTDGQFLNHPLRAMVASGPDDIWAVGGSFFNPETSTIAHWDGDSWTRFESPVVHPLHAVEMTDEGQVWAASPHAASDLALFDGESWEAVSSKSLNEDVSALLQTMSRDARGVLWMFGQTPDARSIGLRLEDLERSTAPRTDSVTDDAIAPDAR